MILHQAKGVDRVEQWGLSIRQLKLCQRQTIGSIPLLVESEGPNELLSIGIIQKELALLNSTIEDVIETTNLK